MKKREIDKVRASRDGHEFHEAWAARKALQLVIRADGLVGIAVEGLAPSDQGSISREAVEIADLVLYHGRFATFEGANSVRIVQFKYSKALNDVPYRASEITKTIRKFAQAYKSHKKEYGIKKVQKKLAFELITNRPIHPGLTEAIQNLALGVPPRGDAKKQAGQFISACGLNSKQIGHFANKISIVGLAGTLTQNKQALSRVVADWSAARDAFARARLGAMRQLIRDKAGLAGEGRNVINRVDVLDALELQSPDDLLPCSASFPKVGKVVQREQLSHAIKLIPKLDRPLLIHAAGGIGKTVFLQSLSKVLSERHETVLFDCFGGGAYRAPDDARHLPRRGLIHIINKLACEGLCDPLLPVNENIEDLVKAFRTRLSQVVATIRRGSRGKLLCLFLDAIDNAAEHAKDKGEIAFPKLLLESFHHLGPVSGVQLIVSCRTHRRQISRGDIACEELELNPFTIVEAEKYLRDRLSGITDTQTRVAYARSEGNPRILEHLALSDRGLLDASEIKNVIKLDDLLRARIQKALSEARNRGYTEQDINGFLAGLSVLPPPVPVSEYAGAQGMALSAVQSFAADLAPLLEHTRAGLMFRDEPTETLVRETYAAKEETLRSLAKNLLKQQESSVYAASALPGLLQKLDDGELLFELAFDDRFPSAITSSVGKRNIRYARLKAAVLHAARKQNFDTLVQLLVELSTLAAVNQRGTDYVVENPDLVIASHDIDATRRLFETRTRWPGTRHARLAIANVLSGNLNDAYRHAVSAEEWINHFYKQDDEYRRDRRGPERLDIACIPLCLVSHNRCREASSYMESWKPWYAYEVGEHVFALLNQAEAMENIRSESVDKFVKQIRTQPAMIAAALSFRTSKDTERRRLIKELAVACQKRKTIEMHTDFHREKEYVLSDGLLKAAALALPMKMNGAALTILSGISREMPRLWLFTDRFPGKDAFAFVARAAIWAAAGGRSISERDLLPQELMGLAGRVSKNVTGEAFRTALRAELEKHCKEQQKIQDEKQRMTSHEKRNAEHFLAERLERLAAMAESCVLMFSSPRGTVDKAFLKLLDLWTKVRKQRDPYGDPREINVFFNFLGRQLLMFAVWTRDDLKVSSVAAFVTTLTEDASVSTSTLIKLVEILSKRTEFQELAGKTAMKAKALIEAENEVDSRASLFAQLARAMISASFDEAKSYFQSGLEQMDAIGSGDNAFTNELLLFTAQLRGAELEELDFHTLSNICELNMPSEEEKFSWSSFARAFSRCSGLKTLAKLGRWSDRDKISLNYTLLPYVAALIEDDKIDPAIALALLRLSDPAELYFCGTEQFAEAIERKHFVNSKELISELILQFEENNPGVCRPDTVATLSKIAERELGKQSDQVLHLSAAAPLFRRIRDEEYENRNYRGLHHAEFARKSDHPAEERLELVKRLLDETDIEDEESLSGAIESLGGIRAGYDVRGKFFEAIRSRVKFSERPKYVQFIARHTTLDIYAKLYELKACKAKWSSSSVALEGAFEEIAAVVIQVNADDFVMHDYLSHSYLGQLSELSTVAMTTLARELIMVFAAPDVHVPASVWMGLATIVCGEAEDGAGQKALKRLLNSNSAKLASTAVDGEWKQGLYPNGSEAEIAGRLIWLQLGSPWAASRWRAAHAIRTVARFGKWRVLDAIVSKFDSRDAGSFQAPELQFYFLHARLWLLITLARLAKDHPQNISKYAEMLRAIVMDRNFPHVLFRHFAAQALLEMGKQGVLSLSASETTELQSINRSPFSQSKTRGYTRESFYQPRTRSTPEPNPTFSLDYDFEKMEISNVSAMFGKSNWETKDAITGWVRKYDPKITSMYEDGGRSRHWRHEARDIDERHHLYGQQLGWHALFLVAGEFLGQYPVIQSPYEAYDSWDEWLSRALLTRSDGLWLADGIDRQPLDTQLNLYEKGQSGIVLTSDKKKLLALLSIQSAVGGSLVVGGDWHSPDNVEVHIGSALVPSKQAKKLAHLLAKQDPFHAWLPRIEEYEDGDEYARSKKEPYTPWIVWPSVEVKLDGTDPLGANTVVRRLHFTKEINEVAELHTEDSFKRRWIDSEGHVVARSEAWGRGSNHDEENRISGERLVCSRDFLRTLLSKMATTELLLLVVLRRYEQGSGVRESQFWHTTGVVRVKKSLGFVFYPGAMNKLHEMKH